MPKGTIFMDRCGDQLGTMQFEVDNMSSAGGPDFPVLTIRTEITLIPYSERTKQPVSIQPLSLIRANGQLHSPEHRVVARFHEDITLYANNPHWPSTTQVSFSIPLDLQTIHRIEKQRGNADLRVHLTFQPLFALQGQNGSLTFHGGRVDGLVFTIPRSRWTDNLLPGLGYGGLEIIEVRHGSGLIAEQLPRSVQEIQEAKKCILDGEWEKSAVHCRKSIEVILDSRPATVSGTVKFRDRVSTFINDNLKVDDSEARLLSGQMQLIWEVTSPAAHPAQNHAYKRADAEFVLRVTMAVVEYFSRLLS